MRANQQLLLGWLRAGLLLAWHAGFPCQSFARARDRPGGPPRLRSPEHPSRLPDLQREADRAAVEVGN
eukprot:7249297-Lingulodinium_polyedra.AAC.1